MGKALKAGDVVSLRIWRQDCSEEAVALGFTAVSDSRKTGNIWIVLGLAAASILEAEE